MATSFWMVILLLAVTSGVLGRMGGVGKPYDPKLRDVGCSATVVLACWILFGWHPLVYLAVFALHWATFSTYWDWLFKGVDNLWFSGLMVGLSLYPIVFISDDYFPIVIARTVIICVMWGCLNKFIPQKGIWIWQRDVVEEFSRYFVAL